MAKYTTSTKDNKRNKITVRTIETNSKHHHQFREEVPKLSTWNIDTPNNSRRPTAQRLEQPCVKLNNITHPSIIDAKHRTSRPHILEPSMISCGMSQPQCRPTIKNSGKQLDYKAKRETRDQWLDQR